MPRRLRVLHLAIALCLSAGASGCDLLERGGPTTPDPLQPGEIKYTAIGASDVNGFGSSAPCFVFLADCENGTGYVFVAARTLRASGSPVTVSSLGIPTAVISNRFQSLGGQFGGGIILGNLIDVEAPAVPTDTTLVTIFAGGNDVNVITAALGGGAGGSDPTAYLDQQVRNFGDDYATLLNVVRGRAPSALIVALNLPNLGALPFLAGASLAQRQAAQRASVRMTTTVVNPLVALGIRVVDLMCDTRFYLASTYSSDGFHPNDAGYAIMASLVVNAATAPSVAAPAASCPPMTLIP